MCVAARAWKCDHTSGVRPGGSALRSSPYRGIMIRKSSTSACLMPATSDTRRTCTLHSAFMTTQSYTSVWTLHLTDISQEHGHDIMAECAIVRHSCSLGHKACNPGTPHPIISPPTAQSKRISPLPGCRMPSAAEDLGSGMHQVGEFGAVEVRLVARMLRRARRRGDQRARAVRALTARVVQQPAHAVLRITACAVHQLATTTTKDGRQHKPPSLQTQGAS